jgi:hypothetical protein
MAATGPIIQITTEDGWVMKGTVTSGTLTLQTSFGDVKVEGYRIRALSGSSFTLDDGSVLRGTIASGALKVASHYGNLTVTGSKISTITTIQERPQPAKPSPGAPVKEEAIPATETAAPPAPVTTTATFSNKSSYLVYLYLDDSASYEEIERRGSLTKELSVGEHTVRAKAMKLLGPIAVEFGAFEKTVNIEPDAVITLTDGDFD